MIGYRKSVPRGWQYLYYGNTKSPDSSHSILHSKISIGKKKTRGNYLNKYGSMT